MTASCSHNEYFTNISHADSGLLTMAFIALCRTFLVTAANSQYMLATHCNILEYENLHPAVCWFVTATIVCSYWQDHQLAVRGSYASASIAVFTFTDHRFPYLIAWIFSKTVTYRIRVYQQVLVICCISDHSEIMTKYKYEGRLKISRRRKCLTFRV